MIKFVNAKINIGLQIVSRRPDGYHDLQTLFYPVGINAGTARNPEVFCDILEITPREGDGHHTHGCRFTFHTSGRTVDCPPEKNLVWRAASLYYEYRPDLVPVDIRLEKHLPDGAGMGGGSADAAFTLAMLANLDPQRPEHTELTGLALRLGADCPFFLENRPCYAEGVGERLEPVDLDLRGKWLLVIKPGIAVSTREAFAGVTLRPATFDLRQLPSIPIEDWREVTHNDFEDSIFPLHPQFITVKEALYGSGAMYASLTGSGSCLYGIYAGRHAATVARAEIEAIPTIATTYLLEL